MFYKTSRVGRPEAAMSGHGGKHRNGLSDDTFTHGSLANERDHNGRVGDTARTETQQTPAIVELHILWITAGSAATAIRCDHRRDSTQPRRPGAGGIPGIPTMHLHHPVLAFENGDAFLEFCYPPPKADSTHSCSWWKARSPTRGTRRGLLGRVRGGPGDRSADHHLRMDRPARPESLGRGGGRNVRGVWRYPRHGRESNRLHGPAGLPGLELESKEGLPIVCVPGCPVQPDNFMEVLLYLLNQAAGRAPSIPLDEVLRPTWLFGQTVHEGCDRAGYYEQGDFAKTYGTGECIVKLGCWGPVVQCNVGKRGWMAGIGGCPNVGGVCIGCTMPGFPDKFMPFLEMPPGAQLSTTAVAMYGKAIRALRQFTRASMNREPEWRTTGLRM